MITVSFRESIDEASQRITVQIIGASVDIDDLLSFCSNQFPYMVGPIGVTMGDFEMVRTSNGWEPYRWLGA